MDAITMELVWEVINEVHPVEAPPGAAYPCEDAGCAYPGEMIAWPGEIAAGPGM